MSKLEHFYFAVERGDIPEMMKRLKGIDPDPKRVVHYFFSSAGAADVLDATFNSVLHAFVPFFQMNREAAVLSLFAGVSVHPFEHTQPTVSFVHFNEDLFKKVSSNMGVSATVLGIMLGRLKPMYAGRISMHQEVLPELFDFAHESLSLPEFRMEPAAFASSLVAKAFSGVVDIPPIFMHELSSAEGRDGILRSISPEYAAIRSKADVNAKLADGLDKMDIHKVNAAVSEGADVTSRDIVRALNSGRADIAETLAQKVDDFTYVFNSSGGFSDAQSKEFVRKLYRHMADEKLRSAILSDDRAEVERIISMGISPNENADGTPALILAINSDRPNASNALLEKGANPNVEFQSHDAMEFAIFGGVVSCQKYGNTLLERALQPTLLHIDLVSDRKLDLAGNLGKKWVASAIGSQNQETLDSALSCFNRLCATSGFSSHSAIRLFRMNIYAAESGAIGYGKLFIKRGSLLELNPDYLDMVRMAGGIYSDADHGTTLYKAFSTFGAPASQHIESELRSRFFNFLLQLSIGNHRQVSNFMAWARREGIDSLGKISLLERELAKDAKHLVKHICKNRKLEDLSEEAMKTVRLPVDGAGQVAGRATSASKTTVLQRRQKPTGGSFSLVMVFLGLAALAGALGFLVHAALKVDRESGQRRQQRQQEEAAELAPHAREPAVPKGLAEREVAPEAKKISIADIRVGDEPSLPAMVIFSDNGFVIIKLSASDWEDSARNSLARNGMDADSINFAIEKLGRLKQKAEEALAEIERKAAEEKARLEAERAKAEQVRLEEAAKLKAESEARAAEQARLEQERAAAQKAAEAKAAQETAEQAKLEQQRADAEKKAAEARKLEEERKAAEAAKLKAEREASEAKAKAKKEEDAQARAAAQKPEEKKLKPAGQPVGKCMKYGLKLVCPH